MGNNPSEDEFLDYVDSLEVGERVIETGHSMTNGWTGEIYISKTPGQSYGSKCVLWDDRWGKGRFGTSVTHGTRRLSEIISQENK